jgi:hypothetical protein
MCSARGLCDEELIPVLFLLYCVLQGIWVSRPASYNPLISFLNEAVMTFMFLFLVNLMTARCVWGGGGLVLGLTGGWRTDLGLDQGWWGTDLKLLWD